MNKYFLLSLLFVLLSLSYTQAQDIPVPDFGTTYDVPNPDFPAKADKKYYVVFDIGEGPEDKQQLNARLNTLARFLNMHAKAGVPVENLKVAGVLHGSAAINALSDTAYQKRYGTNNPNSGLLKALNMAGADVYLCGQSAQYRKLERHELHADVQLALSAMTVLIELQQEGYQLIRF